MELTLRRDKPVPKLKHLRRFAVGDHPLAILVKSLSVESNHVSKKKEETKILDKKLVTTTWDGLDPLSAALSSNHFVSNENGISFKSSKVQYIESDFASWPQFKVKILNKFNTSEKLSIKSSFLNESTSHGNKAVQNVSQRVKNRLEQLDDFEENSMHEMYNLSQQEYVKRVDELNLALNDAWKNDQRVKALKIAIQCAKQLSTINVIHFYPSKFVLITDILDNFGSLVYNRIYAKTADATEDIHFAQETCRNWFYKISSIRELLPRFYIETSILHVYRFLLTDDNLHSECKKIFLRLTKMIRGIGNPLFAAYCRVYLCRVVIQHFPQMKNIFEQNIFDIFNLINQLICTSVQQSLMQQKLDYSIYYTLFTPALDWIFNCHFYKGDDSLFESVFDYFKKLSTINIQSGCSALILNSLITSLPSHFIVKHLIEFVDFIKHVNKDVMMDNGVSTICTSVYPKYILIKNIGDSLNTVPNLFDVKSEDKNLVIGEVWRITGKLKSKGEYVFCFETWAEIIAKYYDLEVINKLLGDIVTNLSQSREFENYSTQLLAIMSKIIQFGSERFSYNSFFAISNLMPYLDLFHKEDVKVEACKSITESFIKSCNRNDSQEDTQKLTSDPVILNSLAYICKIMHDSINALSLEDEKRQISILIAGFIRCVSFSRDFEAQLNFYVESRANFSNLDHVLSFLVQKVNSLAMQTHQVVKGFHTKKTISFVNACIAFSFITIPSIDDIVLRLQLYLSSSHIALINVCLPQTDAFLKSTITLLRQLPPTFEASDGKFYSNDEFLNSYVSQLLSTLIVVPDNPELGMLYLFKGLYNVLKEYRFDLSLNYKFSIWINMLRYLSICSSDTYPYHVDKVDSNDKLYAQDEEFLKEIQIYSDIIFKELLDQFKQAQNEYDIKRHCNNAFEMIHFVLHYTNVESTNHVVNQLWNWLSKMHTKHNLKSLDHKMKSALDLIKKSYTTMNTK